MGLVRFGTTTWRGAKRCKGSSSCTVLLRTSLVSRSVVKILVSEQSRRIESCVGASCDPGAVLYVGDDRRNDYDGATAAGMRAVLFDPVGQMNDLSSIRNLRDILAG